MRIFELIVVDLMIFTAIVLGMVCLPLDFDKAVE